MIRPTCIAGLSLICAWTAVPTAAGAPPAFVCNRDFVINPIPVTGEHPKLRWQRSAPATTGTVITLQAGPGLQAEPEALAAWQRAVDNWQAILQDNVSVVLEGDLASMGENVLGATDFRLFTEDYDVMRDAMVADAQFNEAVLAGLPTFAELNLVMTPSWSYYGAAAAKATLKALGFDMSFDDGNADGTITFNSDYLSSFDFDSSDGIDSTKYDFEAIVTHEIGHALGFYSIVDQVDVLAGLGFPGGVLIFPLDCFRMRPGEGAADFTGNPRLVCDGTTETEHAIYDGIADRALSTGASLGDGYQASHWKADEYTGQFIGIMDPSLAAGVHEALTPNDIRAMGLIGWDVSGVTAVGDGPEAKARVLAAPNPFHNLLSVTVQERDLQSLEIVDASGRRVHAWPRSALHEGAQLTWNGRSADGKSVASGVYFLVSRTPRGQSSRTVIRIK